MQWRQEYNATANGPLHQAISVCDQQATGHPTRAFWCCVDTSQVNGTGQTNKSPSGWWRVAGGMRQNGDRGCRMCL